MTWLLRLYPRDWRRRYGAEVAEIVASRPKTLQVAVDLLGGAVDAHMKPQVFARRIESATDGNPGENDMVHRLVTGCCPREDMPRKQALFVATLTLVGALLLAGSLMIWENQRFHTIALTMSPGLWILPAQPFFLRGHSLRAKIALTAGPLLVLFLIGYVASLIQSAN
jgi:hypothetical protein